MRLTSARTRLNPHTGANEYFSPAPGLIEKLDGDDATTVRLSTEDEKSDGSFEIVAFSGALIDRWWGKLAIETTGIQHESQTTQLLEHDDMRPVGVIMSHEKSAAGPLVLKGHLLNDDASPDAKRLRAQTRMQGPGRPGLKLKSSIGVRFVELKFLEKGDKITCNGRLLEYSEDHDTLYVSKSFLFENSFIYVNPADLNTHAQIMRHGVTTMSVPANSATAGVMSAALANGSPSPAPAPVVRFEDLSEDNRKAVLKAAQTQVETQTRAFAEAFPDPADADWRERMRRDGKTLEEAKLAKYEIIAERERKAAEQTSTSAALADRLGAKVGRDGVAFSAAGAERRAPKIEVVSASGASLLAERMLHEHPGAVHFFGHDALQTMTRALGYESRYTRLESGQDGPSVSDAEILKCATLLLESTPPQHRTRFERFASSGGSGGHAAMDLSVITVKGFLDGFHSAMDEGEDDWGVRICYALDSNQETEIVRWLGYFPQLQPFNDKPEEANVPNYQIQFTNIWYDHTIGLDVMDFMLQKYGKINKLMGQSGAVARRHWNKLAAAQLEANNTGYDKVALFSTAHALGGKAPATQSNDLSAAAGDTYCSVPDVGNMTPSQFNTVLLNAAGRLLTYMAANGEPMNEESRREILVIVPSKWDGISRAAVYSERLDGSSGGAGGGRTNPLHADQATKRGETWDVIQTPRLTATNNYIYLVLLGNDRKPLLKAEPIGLQMHFAGPGSELHRQKNKYGFWGRTMRSTCPGAWSSALRVKIGA